MSKKSDNSEMSQLLHHHRLGLDIALEVIDFL